MGTDADQFEQIWASVYIGNSQIKNRYDAVGSKRGPMPTDCADAYDYVAPQ
jgi:hypothetical protein